MPRYNCSICGVRHEGRRRILHPGSAAWDYAENQGARVQDGDFYCGPCGTQAVRNQRHVLQENNGMFFAFRGANRR